MAREAAGVVMDSACALDLMRVRATDGRFVGHLFDLRCDWRPGEPTVVDALICGRIGMLERLGLREHRPDSVPWSAVERIDDEIVVRAERTPAPER